MVALIGQIKGPVDGTERRDLADTLIAEVVRHAVVEEKCVYPAMEDHVPNGSEEAEHDDIVKLMKQLGKAEPADPAFMETVNELESQLTHHANDGESERCPKLRAHIPREKLVEIGEKVEKAKKLAPTRPHPSAPHSELFHKTVGPGVGMVDRLLDKLQHRRTDWGRLRSLRSLANCATAPCVIAEGSLGWLLLRLAVRYDLKTVQRACAGTVFRTLF